MHTIMDNYSTVICFETRNPMANPLKNVAFSNFRYFLLMSARLRPPPPSAFPKPISSAAHVICERSPKVAISYGYRTTEPN